MYQDDEDGAEAGHLSPSDDVELIAAETSLLVEQIADEYANIHIPGPKSANSNGSCIVSDDIAGANNHGNGTSSSSSSSGNLTNTASVKRVGNKFIMGELLLGRISYLLQWDPISVSAMCSIHHDCNITGPLGTFTEDQVSVWLEAGPRFDTANDHMNSKPETAFNKRRRR